MKKLESPKGQALTRAELKQIKGGVTDACQNAWTACHANCAAGFSAGYAAFAQCINDSHVVPCSPLAGWGAICGNYN